MVVATNYTPAMTPFKMLGERRDVASWACTRSSIPQQIYKQLMPWRSELSSRVCYTWLRQRA
jgi:hypothetical protein